MSTYANLDHPMIIDAPRSDPLAELPDYHYEPGGEEIVDAICHLPPNQRTVLSEGWGNGTIIARVAVNDEAFIVRTLRTEHSRNTTVRGFKRRALGLYRGLGQPSLEQAIAFSIPDELIVTRDAGKDLSALDAPTVESMTADDLDNLLLSFRKLNELGLEPDVDHSRNCTFSPITGFIHLDYEGGQKGNLHSTPEGNFRKLMIAATRSGHIYSPTLRNAWAQVGILALDVYKQNDRFSTPNDLLPLERNIAKLIDPLF